MKLAFVFFQAPGSSLVVQWLRLLASNGHRFNPWSGTKIPHATYCAPPPPTQKRSSLWIFFGLSTLLAYQGKTSISTVGTSTSAYRLSLATMSRSNTGTGTVWEQDSEPSQQASQDTLSRTDEEDEESRSPAASWVGRWWGSCGTQLGHANEDLGGFLPF